MISQALKNLKLLEQNLAKLQGEISLVYFSEEARCRHCRLERELLAELDSSASQL